MPEPRKIEEITIDVLLSITSSNQSCAWYDRNAAICTPP